MNKLRLSIIGLNKGIADHGLLDLASFCDTQRELNSLKLINV
jgi:hypothetical protein